MALAGWLRLLATWAHGLVMTLVERTEEQEAVGDDGYRRIRTDIVFGRLRPGQKLRLEGLKEDYGVSVSTLREILNRLAAEGFVLAEGRRGFEVAAISALEEGEDHGRNDYERDTDELEPGAKSFVSSQLLPEQLRTHQALSSLKKSLH